MKDETINKLLYELDDIIPPKRISAFRAELVPLGEDTYNKIMAVKTRNAFVTLLLGLFLGFLGINRFYIKQYILGALKVALTTLTVVVFTLTQLDPIIKYCILFFYAIVYCLDFGFSFTSCRYVNLKAIKKVMHN